MSLFYTVIYAAYRKIKISKFMFTTKAPPMPWQQGKFHMHNCQKYTHDDELHLKTTRGKALLKLTMLRVISL